jgi:hypothetical protein
MRGQWGAKLRVATGPHGTLPLYFTARRSEIAIPDGHPNCSTSGHPNCSTWPG